MALYLDTSCLLKLFFREPETTRTMELIALEEHVLVSTLTRLEALVHVHARVTTKLLAKSAAATLVLRMDQVLQSDPYELRVLPQGIIEAAEDQFKDMRRSVHCRTLDRLHLAIMSLLGLRRLLTNDDTQARAARALGFEATLPR
jgi:predicted nucleic acid-binding protein